MLKTRSNPLYFDELGTSFDEYMSAYDVLRRKSLVFDYLLKERIFTGKHILEVGCGTGRFSSEIVKRGGFLNVIDIGYNLARKVSDELNCLGSAGDACFLPYPDNTFDFVISSECIEHTDDPEKAVREMCRVCRPEGYVCLTTPNTLWFPALLLAQKTGLRKFSGNENWISQAAVFRIFKEENMAGVRAGGCHILPFQLKPLRSILRRMDRYGHKLYPLMINFGIVGRKKF